MISSQKHAIANNHTKYTGYWKALKKITGICPSLMSVQNMNNFKITFSIQRHMLAGKEICLKAGMDLFQSVT